MNDTAAIIVTAGIALVGLLLYLFPVVAPGHAGRAPGLQSVRQALRVMEVRLANRIEATDVRFNTAVVSLNGRTNAVNSRLEFLFNRPGSAAVG